MRESVMSPRLSVERNAFAPIGKPMAFRHPAAEDEHRTSTRVRATVTFPRK
jgi:hypothetical protein